MTDSDILIRPVLVVSIFLSDKLGNLPDKELLVAPPKYFINFKSRKTFWKYYIFGNQAQNEIFITDVNNKIEFDRLGLSSFAKVGNALTFRTKTPIPSYNFV